MPKRYICIHSHFYQPPRENPWLEAVDPQPSAHPWHDWNARITSECYWPNTRARVLDGEGRLVRIINNYARISFNVGPTLLSWMQENAPETYGAILEADRESVRRFGRGSAIAQVYNHMIMPLADAHDRRAQVIWGVRDFEQRFGRRPEGMWLAETAVDIASLEALAEQGISFTILAQRQCARVRAAGAGAWAEVGAGVDPTRPYRIALPSGRSIAVFFYDGAVSQAVAFEGLLESGEKLRERLTGAFPAGAGHDALVHIATDGETYGHHHRYGEMALAFALQSIESSGEAELTNYASYLAAHPPDHEAEIVENTSWSCEHGVERWRADCGCCSGGNPGWNQAWRGPLRAALDWLRDHTREKCLAAAPSLFRDIWAAREAYIAVILDRSPARVDAFLRDHTLRPDDRADQVRALRIMELQRHAMLMYTSCGWFFDEVSGIEAAQVLAYAGRVLHMARRAFAEDLEPQFLERLAPARSNIAERANAMRVFLEVVKPMEVTFDRVCAHYAVASLFEEPARAARVYCYEADRIDLRKARSGRAKLRVGQVRLTSTLTRSSQVFTFAAAHLGEHTVHAGVRPFRDSESFAQVVNAVEPAFARADFAALLRAIVTHFGDSTYSIQSLFPDDQRRVVGRIVEVAVERVGWLLEQTYDRHAPLMRYLGALGIAAPDALLAAADHVLNANVQHALEDDPPNAEVIRASVVEAEQMGVRLREPVLQPPLARSLRREARHIVANGHSADRLDALAELIPVLASLPFRVDLTDVQIACCLLRDRERPRKLAEAATGDAAARAWVGAFDLVCGVLRVKLD